MEDWEIEIQNPSTLRGNKDMLWNNKIFPENVRICFKLLLYFICQQRFMQLQKRLFLYLGVNHIWHLEQ